MYIQSGDYFRFDMMAVDESLSLRSLMPEQSAIEYKAAMESVPPNSMPSLVKGLRLPIKACDNQSMSYLLRYAILRDYAMQIPQISMALACKRSKQPFDQPYLTFTSRPEVPRNEHALWHVNLKQSQFDKLTKPNDPVLGWLPHRGYCGGTAYVKRRMDGVWIGRGVNPSYVTPGLPVRWWLVEAEHLDSIEVRDESYLCDMHTTEEMQPSLWHKYILY